MGEAVLQFEPETHIYTFEDRVVPGVTRALGEWVKCRYGKYEFYISTIDGTTVDAETFDAAGDFGTAIHLAAPLAFSGNLDWDALDEDLIPPLKQFMKWAEVWKLKDPQFELRVFSKKYFFAGTLDIMGLILNSERAEIDIKTGYTGLVGPQTAAYELAYREEYKDRKKLKRYCLHLPRDGSKFTFTEKKDHLDQAFFLNRLFQLNYLKR